MEKNKLKRIVMIGGITVITAISLTTITILSEDGYIKNGNYIVLFNTVATLSWIFISNIVINYRYKQLENK